MSSSLFSVRSTIFVLNSILYIKLNINTVLISYREDNAVSLLFTMSTQNLVRLIFLGTSGTTTFTIKHECDTEFS